MSMNAAPSPCMDYFRSSFPTLPTPGFPGQCESSHNLDSRVIHLSQDHLSARSSPRDETDPPPFVPSPDDHVSLNQLNGTHCTLHDAQMIPVFSCQPRQHRSTSSIRQEPFVEYEALGSERSASKSIHRGRSKTEQHHRLRRPISAPGKKSARLPPRPHWPSPADRSNRESESGQGDHVQQAAEHSRQHSDMVNVHFEGTHRTRRADTHSGLPIPSEIRLRRASDKPMDPSARRVSLPALGPALARQVLQSSTALTPSNKGELAGAALTQTYIHMYLPSEQSYSERRSSTPDGHRRLSATLQVVRSRYSVYEVIWEDIAAIVDTPSTSSSSSSSSSGLEIAAYFSDIFRPKSAHIKTDLASWSWGGELEPHAKEKRLEGAERRTKPRRPSLKTKTTPEDVGQLANPTVLHTVQIEPVKEPAHQSLKNFPETDGDNVTNSQLSEKYSKLPRPCQTLGPGSTSISVRRGDLLGQRKLSNLPQGQEHFASHRDSLILAHERIFNDNESRAGRKNTRAEQLKRATWHKQKLPSKDVSYSPLRPNVSSMETSPSMVESNPTHISVGQAKHSATNSSIAARRQGNGLRP